MRNQSDRVAIIIPSYKPSKAALLRLLEKLKQQHDGPIIVVNDGSGKEYNSVFHEIVSSQLATVIENVVNLGKGAALKYGLNYAFGHYKELVGAVTADADGQHAVDDIMRVVQAVHEGKGFVLGCREFGRDIPFRSWFGNTVSRLVYRLLLGLRLKDTQTGLRGLPRSLAIGSLAIRSNRYEFETEQLTLVSSIGLPIYEIPIKTIYEDGNANSHFNPFFDSLRIYFVVLRYGISSIATTVVDLLAFSILVSIVPNIVLANLGSRGVALGVQFALLRSFVFQTKANWWRFLGYVGYVALTGAASGVLQVELARLTGIGAVTSKLLVESIIFVFNFLFLRDVLFSKEK
jgi:glycosyltransferase involved in cell wall biosynthesis